MFRRLIGFTLLLSALACGAQAAQNSMGPWRISVTGDLMAHKPQITGAALKDKYDFSPSFALIAPYLRRADLMVGNLETTLSGAQRRFTGYPCFNTPDEFALAVKKAGFDLVSTANNHSLDRHGPGLFRTLKVLDSVGLAHQGSWASQEARQKPLTVQVGPMTVAFVAWTYGTNGISMPKEAPWALGLLSDPQAVAADIAAAKKMRPDLIAALVHCGTEYKLTPPQSVVNLADSLIAQGVDLVLMSHPHVVQPVAVRTVKTPQGIRRGLVAWSLGNFISCQRTHPRDWGVILQLDCWPLPHGTLVTASALPTWVRFRPQGQGVQAAVVSVGDALLNPSGFSKAELARLRAVWAESTKVLLGALLPDSSVRTDFSLKALPLFVPAPAQPAEKK